jgi:hypothetical protein
MLKFVLFIFIGLGVEFVIVISQPISFFATGFIPNSL